jgi:rhodanese-related sulfurtransferase
MKRIALLILLVILLAGCQSQPVAGRTISVVDGSYQDVTAKELDSMLKSKDFLFINVHIPLAGNIAGTDLFIAYDQIEQNLSQLPADKSMKIVLYCRSGRMSAIAAEELVSLGYANVWNLDGGMDDWVQSGYKLEK